jgi:hypothetical protein
LACKGKNFARHFPMNPATKPRAKRDLLKSYYQDSQETENVVERKRIDPIDIDSTGYHAELSYNMMLKEYGLVELIQRDNELVTGYIIV